MQLNFFFFLNKITITSRFKTTHKIVPNIRNPIKSMIIFSKYNNISMVKIWRAFREWLKQQVFGPPMQIRLWWKWRQKIGSYTGMNLSLWPFQLTQPPCRVFFIQIGKYAINTKIRNKVRGSKTHHKFGYVIENGSVVGW